MLNSENGSGFSGIDLFMYVASICSVIFLIRCNFYIYIYTLTVCLHMMVEVKGSPIISSRSFDRIHCKM